MEYKTRRMNKRLLAITGGVAIAFLALAATMPYFVSKPSYKFEPSRIGPVPELQSPCDVCNGANCPPPIVFSKEGIKTLEEAKQEVTSYAIRLPSSDTLPKGFSLKGIVMLEETALLLFLDRPLEPDANEQTFYEKGGIMIWERHRPNVTVDHPNPNPESEWSNVGWYAGYPSWNRGGVADVINFRETVYVRVGGCYQGEAMVHIAESLKG